MKRIAIVVLPLILASCGSGETIGAAAVQAKAEAQEAQAGKRLEAQTMAKVKQSMAAEQKRLQDADNAGQ